MMQMREAYLVKLAVTFRLKWPKPPCISKMALKALIPFPTTHEYESAFSALLAINPKSSRPVICDSQYEGCVVQKRNQI